MSYMTGFMLGTSLVSGLKSMFTGASAVSAGKGAGFNAFGVKKRASAIPQMPTLPLPKRGEFKLAFECPGRRRYRVAPISEELATFMEENISKLEYISTIEVNPKTGSILLIFAEKDAKRVDRLANWLEEHLFTENYETFKRDRKLNQVIYGSITKSIKNTLRQISNTILRETHGVFDIRSFSSLIFGILGFRKMILTGQFPSGVQMIWWAVSLMRGVRIA